MNVDTGPARQQAAIRLSLAVGIGMLVTKLAAFYLTHSSAVFADAAESLIHNIGVAFAAFSLWLGARPANARFQFGYERIAFFSAGFEGALIFLAGLATVGIAVRNMIYGAELANLSIGTLLTLAASLVNLALGAWLVHTGRSTNSIILEANGRHVLSDAYTSFGAIAGLVLVMITGIRLFDPIAAALLGALILYSGGSLVWRSVTGLLDWADPAVDAKLHELLDKQTSELGILYHDLRFRFTGARLLVQVHLLFPSATPLGEAHRLATLLEEKVAAATGVPTEVATHLEAVEDHASIHSAAETQLTGSVNR